MSSLEAIELVDRIWAHDSTVWTGTDEGHWLGWLDEPSRMLERMDELEALPGDFEQVVLLGMGGSSLAPEVIRRTFGANGLYVLDTTHPSAIRRLAEQLDLDRTLFVAASKSGTTLETRSQLDYFLDRGAGAFAAITDPGTELEQFAGERGFLWVVHGEPTIGGRYSALSPFGIVPAVLIDVDARVLLERADDDGRLVPPRRGESRLPVRARAGRELDRGPRQGLHRRDSGRVRALGGAAVGRVDGQGGQGTRARTRRVGGGRARTASTGQCGSTIRTTSARSSSAGSSRRPSQARSSASIRSTSRTCRRPRTRPLHFCHKGQALSRVRKGHSTSCSRTRSRRSTSRSRRSSTPSARATSIRSSPAPARPAAS